MKKVVSFVAAAAIATTSCLALASPYYEDYAKAERKIENVPATDNVETPLDIKSSTRDTYSSHATRETALGSTSSTMTVNAQATLDVSNVAKEWEAYIDAAVNSNIPRETAVNNAKISGQFTIKIESDKAISNEAIAKDANTGWSFDDMTAKLFEKESATYDAATNTLTIVMKIKGSNADFDKYFTDINNGTEGVGMLTLTVPNSTVSTNNALTTAGEYYSVTGTFTGSVTVSSQLKNSVVSFTSTDTEWYKLYKYNGGSGGGGGGGVTRPTTAPTVTTAPTQDPNATVDPNATAAPTENPNATTAPTATPVPNPQIPVTDNGAALNYADHYAYIIGYPSEDGGLAEVRPQANITRAEVATIFFRMLTDESRNKFWTQNNDFSDVAIEDWFNNAVSTAAAAGIITGYEDNTFRPNAPITRAEFAAIASRFSSIEAERDDYFSDVDSHWAKDLINKAAETGWITGYDDGTFRPDRQITRAEAMTLINRILSRLVENGGLSDDMIKWSDNLDTDAWYYANVQEATNSHTYEREALGYVETWKAITEPRDWSALEQVDSKAGDAGEEGSVAEELITPKDTDDETPDADVEASEAPDATASEAPDAKASETPDASEAPEASEAPTSGSAK